MLEYDLGSDSSNTLGNMLCYYSSNSSGKVPGSDSGKESGTISGRNPVSVRVRNRVRSYSIG
jgi:hypothetical protein